MPRMPRIDLALERGHLLRFLVVGAANTAFAYAVYATGLWLGLTFQLAILIALLAGIASGFVLQGKITFKTRLEGRFLPFLALWVLLYLANIASIDAIAFFGADYYLAGLLAAVPVNVLSFFALRTVIFAERDYGPLRLALIWCLGLVAVGRLYVVTHLGPNWDEYLNLSMIYDLRRGDLTEIFQTSFTHLFIWVPYVSANELDQIVAARLFNLVWVGITSWAIYRASRRFVGVNGSLVSALAFNCFGYSFLYGTDFRTDTLATAAMMTAIAFATARPLAYRPVIISGMLIAVGGALTIKSVFLLPTLCVVLLATAFEEQDRWRALRILTAGGVAACVTFVAILALHSASLADQASPTSFLGRTGGATLFTWDYTIISAYAVPILIRNMIFWFLIACALLALLFGKNQLRWTYRIALSSFAFTLTVPLIYSDVYPYYHPFLIAPVAVLAGFGFGWIQDFLSSAPHRTRNMALFVVISLLLAGAALSAAWRLDDRLEKQRGLLTQVHALFPEPVPYIDHTSMVSSFPKKGIFMSNWGMTDYRAADEPIMGAIIARDQPRFILQTRGTLAVDEISPEQSEAAARGLLAADVRSLRDNYQRYWGPIFLPGKVLSGNGTMDILIAGDYRAEATSPIVIAGSNVQPGETMHLEPGEYRYSAAGDARLVWDAPPPPASEPPANLFSGW